MALTALLLSGLLGTGCFKTMAELRRLPREMRRDAEVRKEATTLARDEVLPEIRDLAHDARTLAARLDAFLEKLEPLVLKILAGIAALIVLLRAGAIARTTGRVLAWKGGSLRRLGRGIWSRLRWRSSSSGSGSGG